jgi:type IX secretion system PorP/SprF family membrane protein
MKKLLILSFILITGLAGTAQQLMTASLYDQHGHLFNPATTGVRKIGTVGASYRSMWDGIDGGPKTTLLFGSGYLQQAKIGIGGYLYSDVTGPTRRTGLQTAYAYHIPVGKEASFSVGLEARFQQFSIDKGKIQESLGNDPVMGTSENRIKGDAGLGLAYTSPKFQVGLSVSQLIQSKLDVYTGNLTRNEEARLYRHFYLHGQYNWNVDGVTKIIPNFLMIYLPNAPTEFQAGARIEHNDIFWWGLAMRSRQSWMLSAGVRLQKKFNIGYCFDIYNSPLSVYDKGANAHEIMLRYDFLK